MKAVTSVLSRPIWHLDVVKSLSLGKLKLKLYCGYFKNETWKRTRAGDRANFRVCTTSWWSRPRHQWFIRRSASRLAEVSIICQSCWLKRCFLLTPSGHFCPAACTWIDKLHLYLGRSGWLRACYGCAAPGSVWQWFRWKAASSHYRLSGTSPDTKVNNSQPIWHGPFLSAVY